MAKASLPDLIKAGVVSPGTKLVANYKGRRIEASVSGSGGINVEGSAEELSPSTAAVRITGRKTNGWTFWRVASEGKGATLDQLRSSASDP